MKSLFDPEAYARTIRVRLAELNLQQQDAARDMAVDKSVLCRICKHAKPPSVENYLRINRWLQYTARLPEQSGSAPEGTS